jgi:hypothetical protein
VTNQRALIGAPPPLGGDGGGTGGTTTTALQLTIPVGAVMLKTDGDSVSPVRVVTVGTTVVIVVETTVVIVRTTHVVITAGG